MDEKEGREYLLVMKDGWIFFEEHFSLLVHQVLGTLRGRGHLVLLLCLHNKKDDRRVNIMLYSIVSYANPMKEFFAFA